MDARQLLGSHKGLLVSAGLLQIAVIFIWWASSAPLDRWVQAVGYLISAVVGAALGYRGQIKAAFGVGWRIAAIWFVLWGVIEYLMAGQNSAWTTAKFVEIFIGHGLIIIGFFQLSNFVHAWSESDNPPTLIGVISVFGSIAAVASVIIALATAPPAEEESSPSAPPQQEESAE